MPDYEDTRFTIYLYQIIHFNFKGKPKILKEFVIIWPNIIFKFLFFFLVP